MVGMSVLGLSWCHEGGWLLVLYAASQRRRLQIRLGLEDAMVLGQELVRRPTDRSALYGLVGTLLRQQSGFASVDFALAEANRASAALVLRTDDGQVACPTSTADAVGLAMRTGLPIFAEEALLEAFGVALAPGEAPRHQAASNETEVPRAFRLALDEPPGEP
jgi:hypothetical protein